VSTQGAAVDGLASVARLPVRLLGEIRDEAVGIARDAEVLARGESRPRQGRPALRPVSWGWFAGLGVVTALRVVQPEVAALLAVAHLVERNVHNQEIDEFVGGASEGI